jgi:hypothetical protein
LVEDGSNAGHAAVVLSETGYDSGGLSGAAIQPQDVEAVFYVSIWSIDGMVFIANTNILVSW